MSLNLAAAAAAAAVGVVVNGGGGGGGEIVQLHEVEHVGFNGCVEGVGGEGEMPDGVAVYSRTAGRWVGD